MRLTSRQYAWGAVELAEEVSPSFIVMGTHRRTDLSHLVQGSLTS